MAKINPDHPSQSAIWRTPSPPPPALQAEIHGLFDDRPPLMSDPSRHDLVIITLGNGKRIEIELSGNDGHLAIRCWRDTLSITPVSHNKVIIEAK